MCVDKNKKMVKCDYNSHNEGPVPTTTEAHRNIDMTMY